MLLTTAGYKRIQAVIMREAGGEPTKPKSWIMAPLSRSQEWIYAGIVMSN